MRRWISPPQRDDPYESFVYHTLHYTILLFIGVAVLFLFFLRSAAQFLFMPPLFSLLFASYYLLHTKRLRLSATLFLGGLWSIITIAAIMQNGVRNASVPTYTLIIIYTAIVFRTRTVVIVSTATVASVVLMGLGEVVGIVPFRSTELYLIDRVMQSIGLLGGAGILLSKASQVIRGSIARTREHEQTLMEQNKLLQAEIEERERIAATLRASEERYRILFENTTLMCLVYNVDGVILLANAAAAQALGQPLTDLHGKTLHDLLSPEDAAAAYAEHAAVIESGDSSMTEGRLILPDGTEMAYLRSVTRIPHPSGQTQAPPQVLEMTTDLTIVKANERQVRELEVARERNAFLTDFLSTVSHDLKTPLTTINLNLELLLRAVDVDSRTQRAAQIREQSAMLDHFIQDMLTISRLQHLPELTLEKINLGEILNEVIAPLRAKFESKNTTCRFTPGDNPPTVLGDREQLRRALTNLVENAANYTPEGGEVCITVQRATRGAEIRIKDSGIGIRAEYLPHIFERFYRTPDVRSTHAHGTGLGLAIVKKIMDMHHADVEVESTLGEGTTFRLYFPEMASGRLPTYPQMA